MHDFLMKEVTSDNIIEELISVGYDASYVAKAQNKFKYKNFKIYNLTPAQANILKQTALSVGADCGTHHDVITGKIETSSCLLGGSFSQLANISKKLSHQPFGLKILGEKIKEYISKAENSPKRTLIMGVLNITTDSFSDGGKFYSFDDAVAQLNTLIEEGADIIDIGAESTKPNSKPIDDNSQLEKIIPILEYIKSKNIKTPISIDTRSSKVAEKSIEYGVSIINDVSGLDYDSDIVKVLSKNDNVKLIIQHSKGNPENMQDNPTYSDVVEEIYISLASKIKFAIESGIKQENIIIDAGIGFGKTPAHNLEIIKKWRDLATLGCPMMLGISRKSFLNMPDAENFEKDMYTLALNSLLIQQGIDIIRVHNVKIHKKFQEIIAQ